jgi:hypothetical protein
MNKRLLISESRSNSNRCTPCRGKPNQHVARIPRSIRICSWIIRISRGQCIVTFREVINNDGQNHCSWENGLPTQSTPRRLIDPWVAIEAVGVKPPSIDGRLLGLPGSYHWYAIGTFNTCSRGPTHRSLIDTDGAIALEVLTFHIPLPDLSNQQSPLST